MRIITRGYGAALTTPHNVVIRGFGAGAAPAEVAHGGAIPMMIVRRTDDDDVVLAVCAAFVRMRGD